MGDKVTISKIPIHHQKLKSKQLEERLIKKKITDVQFLQSFIHYSNEKQSHLKRVKSQDLRKKILIYNASLFVNKLLETENEKQRVQKRQEEIKKKLEICSNCSGYKIVCYCGKSMLLTTKKYQLRRKIYQFSKETKTGYLFQPGFKYQISIFHTRNNGLNFKLFALFITHIIFCIY